MTSSPLWGEGKGEGSWEFICICCWLCIICKILIAVDEIWISRHCLVISWLAITPTLQWEFELGVDDYRRKQTKKAEPNDPAFSLLKLNRDLLLKEFLSPISCQSKQPRPKKKHSGRFGNSCLYTVSWIAQTRISIIRSVVNSKPVRKKFKISLDIRKKWGCCKPGVKADICDGTITTTILSICIQHETETESLPICHKKGIGTNNVVDFIFARYVCPKIWDCTK